MNGLRIRWRSFLAIAAFVAASAIVLLCLRSREPSFKGKALSQWIQEEREAELQPEGSRPQAAAFAIRQIGTNGLPYLLDWVAYQPPASPNKLRELYDWVLEKLGCDPIGFRREQRAHAAYLAFFVLRQEAKPAIPRLVKLLSDPARPDTAGRAAFVLLQLRPDGVKELSSALRNENCPVRKDILQLTLGMGTNAAVFIPAIIDCLKDRDLNLASRAATILGMLKLEPGSVVPALKNSLTDSRGPVRGATVNALLSLSHYSSSAVPELIRLLNDPDAEVRECATNAVGWMAPETLKNVAPR